MATLKYKVITSKTQYSAYTNTLEELVFSAAGARDTKDEIAQLTLPIEKYDHDHNSFESPDLIQLVQTLLADRQMKPEDLSKKVIRQLSARFKVSLEAFSR